LANGTRLGRFEIIAAIGSGGMGEVYRAHDSRLNRDVAIKTLPPAFADNPDRLMRFRHEARMLASLNHPNIAGIYDLEKSGDADHLVMELVEGEMLNGPVPVDRALEYARQVAEALKAAHGRGIIHRDLKPANIKVTADGRVKVLDFGLAKAVAADEPRVTVGDLGTVTVVQTAVGHIVGSPSYMSPEQAHGQPVDARTDIWAFGCLLFELLTGRRAFEAKTVAETIRVVLEREPDWSALPKATPATIRELLQRCLAKDASKRLQNVGEAISTIEDAQRGWNRWRIAAIAAVVVGIIVATGAVWFGGSASPASRSEWTQITNMPDSVTQPALSPDGRMVAFIRGAETFFGPGQVYVKMLPDGEPVRLTNDTLEKMSPVFSPDGLRIAYTVVNPKFVWDTWVVPVLGGKPTRWLGNASGLVWTGPRQILFAEVKQTPHMGIVEADENRFAARDVYLPAAPHGMAHLSYQSPDGKSLLLVEMDDDHEWTPCRVIPLDGSSIGRQVGPPDAACTSGAWSPDGKWMYVTSLAGGVNHIWRQRFPDGEPQQVTSGVTSEQGIAMAPDGRSFITAAALQTLSIWIHDAKGERQISSLEGIAVNPRFSADGKKLFYLIVKETPTLYAAQPGDVWVADLPSGHSEALAPGLRVFDFDVSADGRQVVLAAMDAQRKARLWVVPVDRGLPPRQIPNVEGRQPKFGPSGEILFRRTEGGGNFVYRMDVDGSGLRKAIDDRILLLRGLSPDGQWIVAWSILPDGTGMALHAFPLDGGPRITITNNISWNWSPRGDSVAISGGPVGANRTYIIPLMPGQSLPRMPVEGLLSEQDVIDLPGARRIDAVAVPGPSPEVYAFYRGTSQRNLYRIPVQ
jgi:Tol biopolymer transport system component